MAANKSGIPKLGNTKDKARLDELMKLLQGDSEQAKKMRAMVSAVNLDVWDGLPVDTQVLVLEEMVMGCHRLLECIGAYRSLKFKSAEERKRRLWVQ